MLLVKPQFEVGRGDIAKGGKVKSAEAREAAIAGIAAQARELGFEVLGGEDCAVAGAKAGNVEHFLHLRRS